MPAAPIIGPIITAVGAWIGGAAGAVGGLATSAATAAGLGTTAIAGAGAVAATATSHALYGALIGAAASAINGDDIFDGALNGAAYGGITGGVLSLGSAVFAGMTAKSGSFLGGMKGSFETQSAAFKAGAATPKPNALVSGQVPGSSVQMYGEAGGQVPSQLQYTGSGTSPIQPTQLPPANAPLNPPRGILAGVDPMIKAGMLTGAGSAISGGLQGKALAEGRMNELQAQEQMYKDRRRDFAYAPFEGREIANSQRRFAPKRGLLEQP